MRCGRAAAPPRLLEAAPRDPHRPRLPPRALRVDRPGGESSFPSSAWPPSLPPSSTLSPGHRVPSGGSADRPSVALCSPGPVPGNLGLPRPRQNLLPSPPPPEGPTSPSDVIALLLLVPGTRKASLRGVQGARSVPWAWPAPRPSRGPHHLPLDRCRGPVSVCLGRCNQSATNRVTETTHFSPSREPGGPSSSAGRLGPPLTCFCAPLFPTCSLSHGLNCLFKT